MTDRDEFAAAALTGLLSKIQTYQLGPLTTQAYEIADFMLEEREKGDKQTLTDGDDITVRLSNWLHEPYGECAQDLMDEAAGEIERLRKLVK